MAKLSFASEQHKDCQNAFRAQEEQQRKLVSFNPVVEVFRTCRRIDKDQSAITTESGDKKNRRDRSRKEKRKKKAIRRLWYTAKELRRIQSENEETIQFLLSSEQDGHEAALEIDSTHCVRGLYFPKQRNDFCQLYEETLRNVLIEQDEQYRQGICHPDRLAEIYSKATRRSQLQALHRGLQDEYASRGEENFLLQHDTNYISPRKSSSARNLSSRRMSNIIEPDVREFNRPRSLSKLARRWSTDSLV